MKKFYSNQNLNDNQVMKNLLFLLMFTFMCLGLSTTASAQCGNLYIAGVLDGTLGSMPKCIQVCASGPISDLSIYGIGAANNGGGTDGEEFTFPADGLGAGDCIWISTEETEFMNWFGFAPCYTSNVANINGDDAIELFCNGTVEDLFGDPNTDGTGTCWEYEDGWAANSMTTANGGTFNCADWTFSGPQALDGEMTNATSGTPYPNPNIACPTASATCSIDDAGITVTCDDNGTDSDPSDDMFTVTFNPTGSMLGTTYDVSGGIIGTSETYGGASTSFGPYPIGGGALTVTLTDGTDATCQLVDITVTPPATCSNGGGSTCTITSGGATVICDDNGTPADATDDTFTVTLNPTGSMTGGTYDVSGDITSTGETYGAATTAFGPFPVGGDLTITITDGTDGTCQLVDMVITAPGPCSNANCDPEVGSFPWNN